MTVKLSEADRRTILEYRNICDADISLLVEGMDQARRHVRSQMLLWIIELTERSRILTAILDTWAAQSVDA